ncbi:neuronal acetylcholine receptor subunit alpha-6-like [Pomacea canaliculata]|uniref:neuronal acetylcholine receptor subunit alpha-6-like n=1 Tax=Pomacea canaliculata TaxID=400727 RepID=UPI000D72F17A|nr:neuronal acetylcholine receptor subunit alpha-6-like [Pomacea canaliculata]
MDTVHLASLTMLLVKAVFSQSAEDVARVHSDLLTNQFPKVRPEKDLSQVTVVNMSFHLISVNGLDTASQKLSTNGWIKVSWKNTYLEWDPANYSGVWRIFPEPDKVWLPRLTVINSLNELKPIGTSYSFIMVTSDGITSWYPAEVFETFCAINVKQFPFDFQTCNFAIFNWGESKIEVDLQVTNDSVDLSTYFNNSQWEMTNTRVFKEFMKVDGESHPVVTVEITLKRLNVLLVLTAVLPIDVLSLINVFVFLIPPQSEERLSFSMSAFLSYGVFFSFLLDSLPSSGGEVPLALLLTTVLLFLSAACILLCILTSILVHRDDVTRPVPVFTKNVVLWLEVVLLMKRKPSRLQHVNKINVVGVAVEEVTEDSISQAVYAREDNHARQEPVLPVTSQQSVTWLRSLITGELYSAATIANTIP